MNGEDVAPSPADLTDLNWENPPRRHASASMPMLSVGGIQEPLDWWVEQARAGRINLARLSIVALVEDFLRAVTAMLAHADRSPATLARWGSWLVMAADLALLGSRLLLPADAAEAHAARDEAEGLRRREGLRAEMAAAADWLEGRDQIGRDVWTRGQGEKEGRGGRGGDIVGLLRGCLVALRILAGAEGGFRVSMPVWSVADATARIRAMLPGVGKSEVRMEAFLPKVQAGGPDHDLRCRVAVATTFVAGLELAREQAIDIRQKTASEGILMQRA